MKKKPLHAFTLLEILIVISIIMIIALMGIGSFSAARQNLVVDLETDNVVALLYSLRDSARNQPKCSGIVFALQQAPKRITSGCGKEVTTERAALSAEVTLQKIMLDGSEREEMTLLFTPPFGTMQFSHGGREATLIFGLKNKPALSRTVIVDRETGRIEKK